MKKIFAVALVAMMTMTVNAQVYVGGGVGFQTTSQDGNSETFFKLVPEIGYNLDENWAVGIAVGYGEHKTTLKSGNLKTTAKVKAFEIAPYARYTFAKFDKVNLFVDGTVDYLHTDNAGDKNNTFSIGLKPGVAVNLNDKLSFVAHAGFLGYQNSKDDYEGAKAANTFGFDLDGSNLSFGVYYNF
jgi:hypothetical protein